MSVHVADSQNYEFSSTASCSVSNDDNMTTAVNEIQCRRQTFDRERVNLESHQLILLDKHLNDGRQDEIMFTLEECRKIVNYTKFINNVEEALHFIEQTRQTTTLLICSGSFGHAMAPQIHELKNIRSIYIYCHDVQYHKQWSEEYTKVKQVCIDLQILLNDLSCDVKQYLQQEKDGIFSEIDRDNYTASTWTFSWWNYVIDMICHLTYPDSCRQTFLMVLGDYFQDDRHRMKVLDEFESTYTSETAIRWYTRDTFLYRVLNTVLRQKNIEIIFLFGFFIKDIYIQLQNQYKSLKNSHIHDPILKVYRGQMISSEEIDILKACTEFINYSFFSTSSDRVVASSMLNPLSQHDDPLQNILFEIDLDIRPVSQPFGHISNLSYFLDENEVLIMIGARFKIAECSYDGETNTYVVKLELIDNSPTEQKYDFTEMTARSTLKNCVTEILKHLYRVGFEDINKVFMELCKLFPAEEWLNAVKYHCTGRLYQQFRLDRYPEHISDVLSNFEQALTIYQLYLNDSELDCGVDICQIHWEIGFIYRAYVKDYILAIQHYDLGIAFGIPSLQTTINKDGRINLYDKIVGIYECKTKIISDDYQRKESIIDAIRYRQLQLKEMLSYFPSEHSALIGCIYSMAELQNSIGLVSEALINYEKVVQIYLLQNEPNFYSAAMIYGEISKMYIEQKNDYTLALLYKQKDLEFRMKDKAIKTNLTESGVKHTHSDLAKIHHELADIHVQLSQYGLAYEKLITSKHFHEIADSYNKEDEIKVIETKIQTIEQMVSKT